MIGSYTNIKIYKGYYDIRIILLCRYLQFTYLDPGISANQTIPVPHHVV